MHPRRLSADVAPERLDRAGCQADAGAKPGGAHTKAPITRDPAR
jgi:hypothetical protein